MYTRYFAAGSHCAYCVHVFFALRYINKKERIHSAENHKKERSLHILVIS
jgi:hypothetical protein